MALTSQEKQVLRILIDKNGGAQAAGAYYADKSDDDIRLEILSYATPRVEDLTQAIDKLIAEREILFPFVGEK